MDTPEDRKARHPPLEVAPQRSVLPVGTERHERQLLHRRALHLAGDLLLLRAIRRLEPSFACRLKSRDRGPAGPSGGTVGAQRRMAGRAGEFEAGESGAERRPTATLEGL